MLGPFATASRRYIAFHQVSLLSHASYSYSAGGVWCPRRRRQRQRVTEGTAMAQWNGPKNFVLGSSIAVQRLCWRDVTRRGRRERCCSHDAPSSSSCLIASHSASQSPADRTVVQHVQLTVSTLQRPPSTSSARRHGPVSLPCRPGVVEIPAEDRSSAFSSASHLLSNTGEERYVSTVN